MTSNQQNIEIAANAGVLGAISADPSLNSVFGSSALSQDMMTGVGGLYGARGAQLGSDGLSNRGNLLGGGGQLQGSTGVATRGRGGGDEQYGDVDGGQKREGAIHSPSPPMILGSLDKNLVDQVVKRHMNQIRYCYQRELSRSPDIAGKVVVRFIIAGDGSVSKASINKTTLRGGGAVEGCLTRRFMNFVFPEPKNNGIVVVSYPFMFAPG
jgi:hypothetical protein